MTTSQTPRQVPSRFPAGLNNETPWSPLADFGLPDPFSLQVVADDFFGGTTQPLWTATETSGGSVAAATGDGGQWKFTTAAAAADMAAIQLTTAAFTIPPAAYSGTGLTATNWPGKRLFFLARINVTAVATTTFLVGLANKQATPSLAGMTDGIWIEGTSAAAVNMYAYSGGAQQWEVPIPAAALAPYVNNGWVDVGFYYDRQQNVKAFFGFPLIGWLPQSAWGGAVPAATPPVQGPVAAYRVSVSGAWTPTAAVLSPTVYFQGNAQTAYLDFILAAKER